MTKRNTYLIIATLLMIIIGQTGCNIRDKEVIGREALLKLDTRILFSTFVNNSPSNGMDAEVNPPRFRWFYVPEPLEMGEELIRPTIFRFQVADNKEFKDPLLNIDTDINFYNELAPFPEGKTYFWRIGYILHGETEPSTWTETFSVNIPAGTPKWDRTALKNPNFEGHPRLLFDESQLPELRRLAAKDPVFQNDIINAAERMTKHKWWNNWPKTDLDKPDYTYGFYFRLCRELTKTAFAYLVTEDEKYKNILDIWKTIASYPIGGASSPEIMGIGADSEDNTSITEYLACVYDWFYHDFTPHERAIFENSLEWRIEAWMYEFPWGGSIYTGGKNDPKLSSNSLAISGYGHAWEGALDTYPAAIVMYEKSETARKYFSWLANYMIAVGERVAQNDGYDLGAHYGLSHMKWLLYQLMYLNKSFPELQLGKNPLYKKYGEFFIGLVPVGMESSHFGRIASHGAGVEMRKEVFNLLAYLTGDGEILKNWLNVSGDERIFHWRQWIHVAAPLQLDEDLEPVSSKKTKYLFPAIGYVMAHSINPSEPEAFKTGVGVIFCAKPSRGDRYNNENTFQIYAYGEHLNFGGHSGDENSYGHQTIAHNSIMVDGIGQTITQESREQGYRATILAYQEGKNYTYWMGDATSAYPRRPEIVTKPGTWSEITQLDYDSSLFGEKGAPQLERFRRHMLFMRDKYLIIYDDLKTSPERPSIFSWRYRILPECDMNYNSQEGLLSYLIGDVKVHIKHIAFPESLEFLDMKDLDQFKNPITGYDYMKMNKWTALAMEEEKYRKKVAQHNFWFTTKKPVSDHHFLTVVYPVKPGTEAPVITRLDNSTVKIVKESETDIVSFDKNTKFPATIVVDLEALRKPIVFGGNNK
jgi:hypothetical protein